MRKKIAGGRVLGTRNGRGYIENVSGRERTKEVNRPT